MHRSNDVLIEKYRNFEIFFNTEEETFHSVSDYYDTDMKKRTYAATKTAIDNWIRENNTFRPFFVHNCRQKEWRHQYPTSSDDCKITITGIRKDKRFVAGADQISEYDEKDYYLCLPQNESVFEELAPLLKEKETYENLVKSVESKINAVKDKLTLISLKEYKKTLIS